VRRGWGLGCGWARRGAARAPHLALGRDVGPHRALVQAVALGRRERGAAHVQLGRGAAGGSGRGRGRGALGLRGGLRLAGLRSPTTPARPPPPPLHREPSSPPPGRTSHTASPRKASPMGLWRRLMASRPAATAPGPGAGGGGAAAAAAGAAARRRAARHGTAPRGEGRGGARARGGPRGASAIPVAAAAAPLPAGKPRDSGAGGPPGTAGRRARPPAAATAAPRARAGGGARARTRSVRVGGAPAWRLSMLPIGRSGPPACGGPGRRVRWPGGQLSSGSPRLGPKGAAPGPPTPQYQICASHSLQQPPQSPFRPQSDVLPS
jgi:hypothetical protein